MEKIFQMKKNETDTINHFINKEVLSKTKYGYWKLWSFVLILYLYVLKYTQLVLHNQFFFEEFSFKIWSIIHIFCLPYALVYRTLLEFSYNENLINK